LLLDRYTKLQNGAIQIPSCAAAEEEEEEEVTQTPLDLSLSLSLSVCLSLSLSIPISNSKQDSMYVCSKLTKKSGVNSFFHNTSNNNKNKNNI
jgi:hypothetical protein